MTKEDESFLQALKPGDVLVMTSMKQDAIGQAIRWWTSGEYSHVAVYVGGGFIIESTWDGVRKVHWTKSGYPGVYKVVAMRHKSYNKIDMDKVIQFCEDKVGMKYDYGFMLFAAISVALGWVGISTRKYRNWFDLKRNFVCTELAGDAYFETIHVKLIKEEINRGQYEPNDFLKNSTILEKVAEYIPQL